MIVVEVNQGHMCNSIQTLIMSFISPPDTGRLFKIQMYFIYNSVHQKRDFIGSMAFPNKIRMATRTWLSAYLINYCND